MYASLIVNREVYKIMFSNKCFQNASIINLLQPTQEIYNRLLNFNLVIISFHADLNQLERLLLAYTCIISALSWH